MAKRQCSVESVERLMNRLFKFYKNKRIFITGHTGFKGSWMCKVLSMSGARVFGYALEPNTNPNLFEGANIAAEMENSTIGNVCSYQGLLRSLKESDAEIVIHMAAQPLVRQSYQDPIGTYETNVMGTVHILEAIRHCKTVKSFVNVTTDKVYLNKEWEWGYRESDRLDGYDPYSNSKSCSELVTSSYKKSFFSDGSVAISTCRAGNVIGGGDFSLDRIIPDCVRAVLKNESIIVRNPHSTRPYQHVLEPVIAYLNLAMLQYEDISKAGTYNVGPEYCDCVTTGDLVNRFCKKWSGNATWKNESEKDSPHEANYLKLDCSKIKRELGWSPRWHIDEAIAKTVEWSKGYQNNSDINAIMAAQIREYLNG